MRPLALILPLLALAGIAPAARAIDLDELLRKNLEARGGAAKLAAIRSIRFSGESRSGGGFRMAVAKIIVRSGKYRQENSLQGLTGVTAWDGAEGWFISPFGGRKDPERISAEDAKGMDDGADLDGLLIGAREAGRTVEYLGLEEVDGTAAHKIKVTRPDGDYSYVYLDPDHFLEIRVTVHSTVRGAEEEYEYDLGEYAQVEGVWFPMAIDSGEAGGGPRYQHLNYSRVEVNLAVDDSQFRFPGEAAK